MIPVRLSQEEFAARYGEVFDRIFLPPKSLADLWAIPFRDQTWQAVAVVALHDLEPSDYRSLVRASQEVGDEQAIITDVEALPRHQRSILFCWPTEGLGDLYAAGPFGADAAVFGLSGSWGVYFEWEPRLAYVAGTRVFMDAFLTERGIEAIKERLRHVVGETDDDQTLTEISGVLQRLGWKDEVMREKAT